MRRGLTVTLVLALAPLASPSVASASVAGCTDIQIKTGNCSTHIDNNGESIGVDGSWTQPGSPGTNSPIGDLRPGNRNREPGAQQGRCEVTADHIQLCTNTPGHTLSTPGAPAITITDLASFAPEAVTLAAEPDNVGIADMPANFLAEATSHTRTGTLFGRPLTVRFTPAGYDYTYGDGTTATLTTPGRTWEELGQAQFTPTPTSHTYTDRGTYLADVDVRYTAEIDLGGGWQPIAGELTTDGPPQTIRIFEAHTALVAYTCTEKPTAPGC